MRSIFQFPEVYKELDKLLVPSVIWLLAFCYSENKSIRFHIIICKVYWKFDVHGSTNRNINLVERTNKTRQCARIYYLNVS
jgi:hypothetical protein